MGKISKPNLAVECQHYENLMTSLNTSVPRGHKRMESDNMPLLESPVPRRTETREDIQEKLDRFYSKREKEFLDRHTAYEIARNRVTQNFNTLPL